MKRVVFAIAVMSYFVVSSGVVINYHYCMKRLASVHLFEKSSDECGLCGMVTHNSNGCCRDEVKVVKLVQDQNKVPDINIELKKIEQIVSIPSPFITANFENVNIISHFLNHSPPLLSAQDIYLQINVFRI